MGRLIGRQLLIVVGQKNYNEEEFEKLRTKFEEEGATVYVSSNTLEKAIGRLKGYLVPDLAISDVNASDYDAIVLTGGYGARLFLWDDIDTHKLVKKGFDEGKIIAASSTAPVTLANASVVEGKKISIYPDYDSARLMEAKGAKLIQQGVVVDDNIITCNHTRYIDDFAEAIISSLIGTK
jgi:protease I